MYLLGRLNMGGVEISALRLLTHLTAQYRVNPVIYAISGQTGYLDDRFRSVGATILYGKPGALGLLAFFKHVRAQRPDIVHSNVSLPSGFYLLIAWLAGVKIRIAQFHSTALPQRSVLHRAQSSVGRLLVNRFATHIVGVSDGTRSLVRAAPEKWQVIYNGVPAANDVALAGSNPFLITLLGRLAPEKNLEKAVEIFGHLKSMGDQKWTMQFVGPGTSDETTALKAKVLAAGLERDVHVTGPTDNPLVVLKGSGLLLLTSNREGLPTVVLEALSVGTPVVASALPGVLEIAGQVNGVIAVPVAAPADEWTRAITQSAAASRQTIASGFAHGPFGLDRQLERIARLWTLEAKDAKP